MATDRVHLLLYRTLLFTTAVAALALGFHAGLEAPEITPEYQLTGYWQAYGLLVFAALSAYLGAAPPGAGVLWLVVLFHKASMTMTAVLLLRHDVTGAPAAAMIDGALMLAVLLALGLRVPAARAATVARDERLDRRTCATGTNRSTRPGAPATNPERPLPLETPTVSPSSSSWPGRSPQAVSGLVDPDGHPRRPQASSTRTRTAAATGVPTCTVSPPSATAMIPNSTCRDTTRTAESGRRPMSAR